MKLSLYARKDKIGQRLRERIRDLMLNYTVESFEDIDKFTQSLRQPVDEPTLAVILAGSQSEFSKILEVGDLLEGLKIIVIVPDRSPETISAALKLHPRYLSYADGDFLDVSMVARRILQKFHSAPV